MTGLTDPTEPTEEGYALAVPFIACTSRGGPYDDQAFTAGFAAGTIDRALIGAAVLEADRVSFTTYSTLIPQLELLAMHRGFPVMETTPLEGGPEWSLVTFSRGDTP